MMSDYVRKLWTIMSVICSAGAFAFVLLDDDSTAFTMALSGLAFFLMAEWQHDDLDLP